MRAPLRRGRGAGSPIRGLSASRTCRHGIRAILAAMTTLHLIRHGQASAGAANYDVLSPRGREQARHLGTWWRARGFALDAAFTGTLERQRHTADIALEAAGIAPPRRVHAGLDEYDHRAVDLHVGDRLRGAGPGEGAPADGASGPDAGAPAGAAPVDPEAMTYADYATVMRAWRDAGDLPGGVEPWHDFAARGWDAMRELQAELPPGARVGYFTSGGVISTVLAAVLELDFEHAIDAIWRIRNASVTTLDFDGESPRLVEFNVVSHLEVHADPELVTLI